MLQSESPSTPRPRPHHHLSIRAGVFGLLAGLVLAAGACGAAEKTTTTDSDPSPARLAYVTEDIGEAVNNEAATAGTDKPLTVASTTTTQTVYRAPVTTIKRNLPTDVNSLYKGVIGQLEPTTKVVDTVIVAPPALDGAHPLTGLAGTPIERPAAVVKVDNSSAASPHTGLNAADIVIEEEVEGGVTRLAAIFQSQSSTVGPVRSGRTTDISLISSFGKPLFLYSGANDVIDGIIRRQSSINNRSYATSSGYWRDSSRRAPSNLYTDTGPHWATAASAAPAPQFHYRQPSQPVVGQPVESIAVTYGANRTRWDWRNGQWFRSQRGRPHSLVGGEQVSAANVIVIEADKVDTGLVDTSGGMVPEIVFVGTGKAVVYTEGKRIDGTWTRPSLVDVAALTDSSGSPIRLTPGRTWIQLTSP